MRSNLDKATALEIAEKYGLEWEVENTFKKLKKQFGKKVADAILWSMALDEWDLQEYSSEAEQRLDKALVASSTLATPTNTGVQLRGRAIGC